MPTADPKFKIPVPPRARKETAQKKKIKIIGVKKYRRSVKEITRSAKKATRALKRLRKAWDTLTEPHSKLF